MKHCTCLTLGNCCKGKRTNVIIVKRIELNKDGVPHSYTIMILKTKSKLFHLAIHYVSCETSFPMAINIINYTYEVLSNPSLRFCTCHHVNNIVRVVFAFNLQHISDILWYSWVFLVGVKFHYPPKFIVFWLVYSCVHGKASHHCQPAWMHTANVPMTYMWSHVWNAL
jgi:hypothetical protein